ncbi:MAG: creatininase family protein [Actinobacteria bacterium]|nr:creatininase family protein [Actinomycetota bacterium]
MAERRFERLRPQQAWDALAAFPCVYVPFGPIEWHSRHLPVGTDFLKAQGLCLRAAERSGGLVFPMLFFGVWTVPWPLGMRTDPNQVQANAATVMHYLARNGVKAIMWLSGHGGTEDILALRRAAHAVMQHADVLIQAGPYSDLMRDQPCSGDHAGGLETSFMLNLHPDVVDLGALNPDPSVWPEGVGGEDPRKHATLERGRALTELVVGRLAEIAQRLVATTDPVAKRHHRQCVAQQVAVEDMVVYGRAHLSREDAPLKVPTPEWIAHLEAYRTGDYLSAIKAGAEVIEWCRQHTAGRRPAGTEYERIV